MNDFKLAFPNDQQDYVLGIDDLRRTTENELGHQIERERKILIVDDQSSNIEAMKILLKYRVGLDTDTYCVTALSGMQALDIINKDIMSQQEQGKGHQGEPYNKFELILMDCDMPGLSGYETTQKIREFMLMFDLPQPIISAVTGITDQRHVKQASESGMNQIISKPINLEVLTNLVKKMRFPVK